MFNSKPVYLFLAVDANTRTPKEFIDWVAWDLQLTDVCCNSGDIILRGDNKCLRTVHVLTLKGEYWVQLRTWTWAALSLARWTRQDCVWVQAPDSEIVPMHVSLITGVMKKFAE